MRTMKKMRKMMGCLLALMLAVTMLAVSATAADTSAFALENLTLTIGEPSDTSRVNDWVIGANSASVTGKGTALRRQTSGLLTLEAEEGGLLSFSYSSNAYSVSFGGTADYSNDGENVVVPMVAGDTFTIQATFNTNSEKTLSITGITFNNDTVAYIGAAQYSSVESALSAANSGDTVRLIADATVTEDCTVPSGVTLLVPYSADDTGATDDYDRHGSMNTSAYVTLTVANGADLTVANGGKLVVNAKVMGYSAKEEGLPSGTCGEMVLNGGLTVAGGGTLYARGYITGSGSIDAQNGASIYQLFQIKDYRGGSTTMDMMDTVFPVNSYLLENIQVDTTYAYGAKMYGQYFISAGDKYFSELLPFLSVANNSTLLIGTDSDECLFKLSDGASADLSYANGTLTMTTHGTVQTGAITLSAATGLSVATIDSADLVCPFASNLALVVGGDSTFTFYNDFKVLPGASIQVNEGGVMNVDGGLYIYDHDDYLPGFTYGQTQAKIGPSATLHVDGTLNGTVYSSDSACGNITAAGYAASAGSITIKECIGAGSSMTYNDVVFHACSQVSSAEEEAVAEEAIEEPVETEETVEVEETVEEPVEEIVEIETPELAAEEAPLAA